VPRVSLRLRWIAAGLVAAAALAAIVAAVDHGTGDGVRLVPQAISGPVARQAGRAAQRFAPGASVLSVAGDTTDASMFDVSVRLPSGQRETIAVDNRFHAIGLASAPGGLVIGGGQ
jgi:hypothetical protein